MEPSTSTSTHRPDLTTSAGAGAGAGTGAGAPTSAHRPRPAAAAGAGASKLQVGRPEAEQEEASQAGDAGAPAAGEKGRAGDVPNGEPPAALWRDMPEYVYLESSLKAGVFLLKDAPRHISSRRHFLAGHKRNRHKANQFVLQVLAQKVRRAARAAEVGFRPWEPKPNPTLPPSTPPSPPVSVFKQLELQLGLYGPSASLSQDGVADRATRQLRPP